MNWNLGIQDNGDSSDKIQIMSMHRSKGLEWDYVVVHDVTEGGFFGENNSKITDDIIEEERRLFYVAITRVKKHLFIVSADDLTKLSAWYDIKNNSYPKGLKCKDSLRFLYESNLTECENYLNTKDTKINKNIQNKMFKKYNKMSML